MNAVISRLFQPADEFAFVSKLFLRALALIYFAAFTSLAVQITGLVGPDGILPFQSLLDYKFEKDGISAILQMPTLFWLNSSDLALKSAAILGSILSLALLWGRCEKLILILLFVLYLSLYHAAQIFTNFQWDTLLLESGFLAIFLVNGPNRLLIFMFHWLLFRLRFMSGVSKLASGDPSWRHFDALKTYFETQPLAHMGSWYAHHLPEWLLTSGVALTFFSELIVPFFIFMPRRFRLFAAGVTILMQSLIIATSNHNFINLLTIVLCLFLLDDQLVNKWVPARFRGAVPTEKPPKSRPATNTLLGAVSLLIIVSSLTIFSWTALHQRPLWIIGKITGYTLDFGLGLDYHVFPTMQTERQELDVQGSYDGKNWQSYTFRYKPGPLDRKPPFIVPHQPRLDWMIWFVPSQGEWNAEWFEGFMDALKRGSPAVLDLLKTNPFPNKPPRYLRVLAWDYHFTTPEERKATGNWWKREYLGVFPNVPPRSP